ILDEINQLFHQKNAVLTRVRRFLLSVFKQSGNVYSRGKWRLIKGHQQLKELHRAFRKFFQKSESSAEGRCNRTIKAHLEHRKRFHLLVYLFLKKQCDESNKEEVRLQLEQG